MTFAVFAAAFLALAAGAYPWLAPRDAGDLAVSAVTLFPAHPPGYPLYALTGKAWLTALPWGNEAYRLNLLSALAAAGAAALLFSWARRRVGAAPAAALAAAFALTGAVRKFAGLSEMYAAQPLFLAALLWLADGDARSARRRAAAAGLAAGLGLVNHPTLLLALPGLAWYWRGELTQERADVKACLRAFWVFAAAGLALEAFLAVRLGSVSEAWRAFTRAEYGSFQLFSGLTAPLTPGVILALVGHWLSGVSLLAAALAAAGARVQPRRAQALWAAALAAGPLFFVLSRFDLSGWVARSVLESAFVTAAFLLVAASAWGLLAVPARARLPLALAAAVWAAWGGRVDGAHREDFAAYDYVKSLRRLTPPGATILAGGDTALFGLRYAETLAPAAPPRRIRSTFSETAAADVTTGLPLAALEKLGYTGRRAVVPEGLVQRPGGGVLGERGWALVALRPGLALEAGESYAHDLRLSYAFAHYISEELLTRAGKPTGEHALWAAALDPEDYSLTR